MIWFIILISVLAGLAFGLLIVELTDRDELTELDSWETVEHSRPRGNVTPLRPTADGEREAGGVTRP